MRGACILFFLVYMLHSPRICAQETRARVSFIMDQEEGIPSIKEKTIQWADSLEALARALVPTELDKLRGIGYIGAGVDSLRIDSLEVKIYLHLGKKYSWAHLDIQDEHQYTMRKAGVNVNRFKGKEISWQVLESTRSKWVTYMANTGYPFASAYFSEISSDGHSRLTLFLALDPGPKFVYDSLVIMGTSKVKPAYLRDYLGFKKGRLYSENNVKQVARRVRDLAFLEETQPAEVLFTPGKASVYTYLKSRKANQFYGLVGFMPNETTPGKLVLTGELDLKLQNALARGEHVSLRWQKLERFSQELESGFLYPYILGSRLGLEANIQILKKDTTYLRVKSRFAVPVFVTGYNQVNFFVHRESTSLLSYSGIAGQGGNLAHLGSRSLFFGAGYSFSKLDYRWNPRSGYLVSFNGMTGTREVIKDAIVPTSLYEGIQKRSIRHVLEWSNEWYIPIKKLYTCKLQSKGGYMESAGYFKNELFRLGGLYSIRGFDDHSFHASKFITSTFEFRMLFEQNSAFFLFFDGMWYRDETLEDPEDFPRGFGAGLNFDSRAGIFSLTYALGQQRGNPVDFRAAKIHLGYINRF